jgi:toxin YhaV
MLESGHPPDNWNDLLVEAKSSIERLQKVAETEL